MMASVTTGQVALIGVGVFVLLVVGACTINYRRVVKWRRSK